MKSLLEHLSNHSREVSLCGFSTSDVETLLEAALDCNVFRFNNNFYAQKRGLAMGMRIAPLLAIIYLDQWRTQKVGGRGAASATDLDYIEKVVEEGCRYCTDQNICHLRGTAYLIKCRGCGHRYTGESGRPLRKRLDEHRRAFERPQTYPNNSFSKHRTTVHTRDSAQEFEVVVLHRHREHPS
ncbi:hypothetical protein Y032_0089g2259 [Ancylostoma ceylanicum]|uniref:GIY-YIG domain-containing protein n=1 Tax=Ancylostoma ceylanicum TaxID=53326 RepID=A0A016TN40_9BILA|nr:hypothetical protein Y032_0089g2259 [Ancylostoma ceylanicum]